MVYRDLREWIDHLEKEGELVRIKEEINLEPDVGAIGQAVLDTHGPGILAERIVGCENKLSFCLHASPQRAAMGMGLRKEASIKEQKEKWIEALNKYPVKPKMVEKKEAPCKENILRGEEVNLFKFPIPKINTNDAAPYILKTLVITKDPDSDWINFGMYRMQVLDRRRTCIMFAFTRHAGEHYTKSRRLGKPLEVAVALGVDPALAITSGTKIPRGWNEFDFAGALRGEPVEVVNAESVALPVPATAEIVLEGVLRHDVMTLEGPFGEFPGSYSGCYIAPVFEINTITHRNDPIYDGMYLGRGTTEGTYMTRISKLVALEQELKRLCPSITEITYLEPPHFNCVIQGRWLNKTEPRHAMLALWSSEAALHSKMVTVVDEDIDPWNAEQVMWAIANRCQANKDVIMVPGTFCQLDPSHEEDGTTCKFGIDATKAMEPNPRHFIAEYIYPREGYDNWKERILRFMKGGEL